MAVTIENSVQLANQLAHPPVEMESHYIYGKLRVYRFEFTQGAALGDALSSQRLIRLPAGKVTLFAPMCWAKNSAWSATAVLDIGWEAYRDKSGVVVAADPDGLVVGMTVATASAAWNFAAPTGGTQGAGISGNLQMTFESSSGVVIYGNTRTAGPAAGGTLKGFITVAVE